MITINHLTKKLFGEILFENVSFVLNKGDKVGLVGPNGSGKSTLLKMILGKTDSDGGSIYTDNERIGYLAQEFPFENHETIERVLSAESSKIRIVLEKVGLGDISPKFAVNKLSGGQKTRLALAKIILQKPSVLLLDEPTNHLDSAGLVWLEELIREFGGIVLVISHDRALLDHSVQRILEIDSANHAFHEYNGGYTTYVMEKEKRLAKQEDNYQRQQKELRRMELWLALKRQEASVHPDPAKGRMIRGMERRMQREIYDQAIERPKSQKKITGLNLKGSTASAKLILRARDIAKSIADRTLFRDVAFEIRGQERVLLAGENGSGKTTLLKMLMGEINPNRGEFTLGERVHVGYFAQEHEVLNRDKTVMDEFLSTDRLLPSSRNPRSVLGAFLFSGDDIYKKVAHLSLGERVRLIFAKLTNQENELLILDEPTNHLDIASREIIEEALINYQGAVLVVSHDRYFLERIGVDRMLKIEDAMLKENLR